MCAVSIQVECAGGEFAGGEEGELVEGGYCDLVLGGGGRESIMYVLLPPNCIIIKVICI